MASKLQMQVPIGHPCEVREIEVAYIQLSTNARLHLTTSLRRICEDVSGEIRSVGGIAGFRLGAFTLRWMTEASGLRKPCRCLADRTSSSLFWSMWIPAADEQMQI